MNRKTYQANLKANNGQKKKGKVLSRRVLRHQQNAAWKKENN